LIEDHPTASAKEDANRKARRQFAKLKRAVETVEECKAKVALRVPSEETIRLGKFTVKKKSLMKKKSRHLRDARRKARKDKQESFENILEQAIRYEDNEEPPSNKDYSTKNDKSKEIEVLIAFLQLETDFTLGEIDEIIAQSTINGNT
jgi:hypothetical protein